MQNKGLKLKDLSDKERDELVHKALGNSTRNKIMELLSAEDLFVSEIIEITRVEPTLLSHHFDYLKYLELIEPERIGKAVKYKIKKDVKVKGLRNGKYGIKTSTMSMTFNYS